ncbi:DUF3892 domain-containing protein [Nannocystis sp. RBIL2]|uniref:DUF3892 domain-containing protein n=1 Tax=Nannocystis sp. RBIL2 TaxID=2996788 RepID=UPI002270B773|nr:DUF3892 domain-containing protein [Nannocystis sp. RBIL2]MCY1072100.1 DUF3892 domain-containing protein [Nannocystis sp. RBIL2]
MADVRVYFVTKEPRTDRYSGITFLGGSNWKWSVSRVIRSIEAGTDTFYTLDGTHRAEVGVVKGEHGKHVQTHANGHWNDNLLALPDFPPELRHRGEFPL